MAGLSIKKDTSSHLVFKSNDFVGLIFILMSGGLIYLSFRDPSFIAPKKQLIFYIVNGVFGFFGVLAFFYRTEVRFELFKRRYVVKKGFFLSPNVYNGSFDSLEGLWLTKKWQSSGSKNTKRLHWEVEVKLKDLKRPLLLFSSMREDVARAFLKKRARQLKTMSLDKTGQEPVSKDWGSAVQEPLVPSVSDRAPDQKSLLIPEGMTLQNLANGAVAYWTPAPGFDGGSFLAILFALPFFLVGSFFLVVSSGLAELMGLKMIMSGPVWIPIFLGSLFAFLGGAAIKAVISYTKTQHRFLFSRQSFQYASFRKGKKVSESVYKYSSMTQYGVRKNTARKARQTVQLDSVKLSKYSGGPEMELFFRDQEETSVLRHNNALYIPFIHSAFEAYVQEHDIFEQKRKQSS